MKRTVIDHRYKILKRLGAGAMGEVYKVKDLKNKNIIALKLLSKKKTSSEVIQRFKREFQLLAGLRHPNLCAVYDFGTLKDGRSYFTMEYVDGENIFKASKELSYKEMYPWIVQLCRALQYIHSKGLIHYDIKPGNVLIQRTGVKKLTDDVIARSPASRDDEAISKPLVNNMIAAHPSGARNDRRAVSNHSVETVVKLMDFGLAGEQRIRGGVMIRGTFPYIAPEVIKGLSIDHRADLYSLGILLYEIATRRTLKVDKETSFAALLHEQQKGTSRLSLHMSSRVPRRLRRLLTKLVDSEAANRFSRANEIIGEINTLSHSKFEFETEKTIEGYLLSSQFVGREKEMELLALLYEKARRGEGKVVFITGDVGIGKSRFLKEFKIVTQLKHSHTFIGYAHKGKTGSLEPFYEIFSELVNYLGKEFDLYRTKKLRLPLAVLFKIFPDLTDGHLKKNLPKLVSLEPKQEKLRNFEALSELIGYCASSLGELVILLEDLHWADDLSIQFLEYLGRNITDRNIFICGTCRREELKANTVFKSIIKNLRGEGNFIQVELKPLKLKSLYSFLDSTITSGSNSNELAKYLMKKTGGNPFFVEEIMRTLLRKRRVTIGEKIDNVLIRKISIPSTIEDVVLKRVKDLDKTCQRVINHATILLKEFNYDIMKRLTGLNDTELSEALWQLKRRQILVEEDNRYRFYHATLADAINKRMAYREKRKLYYQAGKTLEFIYKKNTEGVVEDLAYYFINAQKKKKGVRYGLQAAHRCRQRYADEQAIQFYKGVFVLLGTRELATKYIILLELAQTEVQAGYYDDAVKNFYRVLNMRGITVDRKIGIYGWIAGIYDKKGNTRKELNVHNRVIRLLAKMRHSYLQSLLKIDFHLKICRAKQKLGHYRITEQLHIDPLKLYRKNIKDKRAIRLLAEIHALLGLIEQQKGEYGEAKFDRALHHFQQALKYCRKLKDERVMADISMNLGVCYYLKHDYSRASGYYQKSIQISERLGYHNSVMSNYFNLGILFAQRGMFLKACDCYQRASVISKKFGNAFMSGNALSGLGGCLLRLCDHQKARECFEESIKIFETLGWIYKEVYSLGKLGYVYQTLGTYIAALKLYKKALKIAKSAGDRVGTAQLYANIGSVLLELGELVRAQKYFKKNLRIADRVGAQASTINCYVALCRLNLIAKNYSTAEKYYRIGQKISREIGVQNLKSRFYLLRSEILYGRNDYLKGLSIANKVMKKTKNMGAKDWYVEALLTKIKHEIKINNLTKIEISSILEAAKAVAEEIGCPEILWKVYFEYGKFHHNHEEYLKALDYYGKCCEVFKDIGNKIENESYQYSYLDRPDRQEVFTAIEEVKRLVQIH